MSIKNLRFTLLLALLIGVTFSSFSQEEKTAAKLYNEGLALLKAKDYAAGLPILEQALEKATAEENEKVIGLAKKNGAKAAYNLGNSKKKEKNLDEALALYEKGIAWSPKYASNYRGLAGVQDEKGDKMGAIKSYIMSADLTAEGGKVDKAAKLYKKAQNIVGKIYQAKEYENAIAAGKAFLEMKDDNAEVNYYITRAMTESSPSEDAITYIDKSISLSGADVNDKYYVAKAKVYEKLNKNTEAIEVYKLVKGEKYKEQAEYKIKTLGKG